MRKAPAYACLLAALVWSADVPIRPLAVAWANPADEDIRAPITALLARREAQLRVVAKVVPEFWPWLATHPDIRAGLLLAANPAKPLHAENLDALRQAVTPAQANTYAHLLLAAALHDAAVQVPAPTPERAGAMADTDGPKLYPPRLAPSLLEQVKAQVARLETQVPEAGGLRWPLFPVKAAPYYLLHPLTCEVSLREQAFLWKRFASLDAKPDQRVLSYGSAVYGWEYTKPEVRSRKSGWEPDSIPRILEDGGVCGRLARMEATSKAVLGMPAATAGQPGHCALMFVVCGPDGKYAADIGQSATGDWSNTTPHAPLGITPAIAGFEREAVGWLALIETANRVRVNDYAEALAFAQLAEEATDAKTKTAFLRRAVAANPYHLAAWEALVKAEGTTPEAFNAVCADLAHALVPEGGDKAVRADGTRIVRVWVARQVGRAYAGFLAKEGGQAQVLAAFTVLIEHLDDDGLLGTGADIWPLYLRHLAKAEPDRALETAQASLELALLGRREDAWLLDESASKTLVAVRALHEVCACLPVAQRIVVWTEAGQKIESVYPHFEAVGRPELIGGKTRYPKKALANKFYAEARMQLGKALREAGQAAQAAAQEAAFAAERAAFEKEAAGQEGPAVSY